MNTKLILIAAFVLMLLSAISAWSLCNYFSPKIKPMEDHTAKMSEVLFRIDTNTTQAIERDLKVLEDEKEFDFENFTH